MLPDIDFKSLTFIALLVIGLSTLIQMIYYWLVFSRLSFYKNAGNINANPQLPPVSVVICARNEYLNLEQNLPLILSQDYPNFEVVIVNDCSDDGTDELLSDFARADSRVKVVHLTQSLNFFRGKKFPLSMGIKSASNEILLLTDADCKPLSNQWIKSFATSYEKGTEVVIGFSSFEKNSRLLNLLIRFDNLQAAIWFFSRAIAGKPFMAIGRNLSYRKSLFLKNKGFTSHYNIPTGDDDLFIAQVANKKNTRIEISPDTKVITKPKTSLGDWFRQKRRHMLSSAHYQAGVRMMFFIYSLSQLLFYLSLGFLFFTEIPFYIPISIFFFRYIQQLIIYYYSAKRLQETLPLTLIPLFEVFFLTFTPLLVIYNIFAKPPKWM